MEPSTIQIKMECEDLPQDNPDLVDFEEIKCLKENEFRNNFKNNSFYSENIKSELKEDEYNSTTSKNELDINNSNKKTQPKKFPSRTKMKCEQYGILCCDKSVYSQQNFFQCEQCDMKFKTKKALVQHSCKYEGKELQCEICLKFYKGRGSLREHIKIHKKTEDERNKQIYSCDQCGSSFKYLHSLKSHMRYHTDDFKCHVCGKPCVSKNRLRIHLRTHTGEKPYECEICTQKFISKYALNSHSVIHESNRQTYKCDSCDKVLASKNALRTHGMLVHSTEKKHQCRLCDQRFKLRYLLTKHYRKYHIESKEVCQEDDDTGQNQQTHFKCHICSELFVNESCLRDHLQQHTNEPVPFKCDICDKVFKNKKTMRTHQTQVHATELKYYCKLCGEKFQAYHRLRSHLIRHKKKGEVVENHPEESNGATQHKETKQNESMRYICRMDCSDEVLEKQEPTHDVKPFKCECFMVFFNESDYKKHLKNDCEVVRVGLKAMEDFKEQNIVKEELEIGFQGVKVESDR